MNKLVVNADDFGISHEVNMAIVKCFKEGYINQTTIMVNMPFFDEAVALAKENGFENYVGLHLNLVEGMPLTEGLAKTSLLDDCGRFNSLAFTIPQNRVYLNRQSRVWIRNEIVSQIEVFLKSGMGGKFIDSHQHSHVNLSILDILLSIIGDYRFERIRLARNIPYSSIKGLKRLAKYGVNKRIIKYNKMNSLIQIHAFGSMKDITQERMLPAISEMMVHPIMKNNTLCEAFSEGSIDEWWNINRRSYLLV